MKTDVHVSSDARRHHNLCTSASAQTLQAGKYFSLILLFAIMTALLFVVGQWCQKTKQTLRFKEVLSTIINYLLLNMYKTQVGHSPQ